MADLHHPTALIVIDVQGGFDDPSWGAGNNPDCEHNVGALIAGWRELGLPLVFVRHDSEDPASRLHPRAAGQRL